MNIFAALPMKRLLPKPSLRKSDPMCNHGKATELHPNRRASGRGGLLIGCLMALWPGLAFALPVFPNAQGFGTDTVAGSGRHLTPPKTTIYRVTSLADSGAGTLRECAEASGPRSCVFETAGYVKLNTRIDIREPFLTIAGQTSPGGIELRGAGLKISASDVLIQHIGVRVGDDPNGPSPDQRDGLVVWRDASDIRNVVIDHVSITWALDEACSTYVPRGTLENVTFSNVLFGETLKYSIHSEDYESAATPTATAGTPSTPLATPRPTSTLRPWITPTATKPPATPVPQQRKGHSMGCLIDHHSHNITFAGNLFAHLNDRNIRTKEDVSIQFINNVVYNWGGAGTSWNTFNMASPSPSSSPANLIDFIGNYYKRGPNTPADTVVIHWKQTETPPLASKVYVKGNIGPLRPTDSGDEWEGISGLPTLLRSLEAVLPIPHSSMGAMPAYEQVLKQVGASLWSRYPSDTRIIAEVEAGSGSHKDCVGRCPPTAGKLRDGNGISAEPGGWPEVKEVTVHHTLPAEPNKLMPSGYTALEEWIHNLPHDAGTLPVPTNGPTAIATGSATVTATPDSAKQWRCASCVEE